MSKDELTVQVVDRRLQVDLDQEEGMNREGAKNEFMMGEQGFQSKQTKQPKQEYSSEQQEQAGQYNMSQLIPKQNQKERLIQQNIKLKTQIYELAKQLDEILVRDRSKKKNYGIGLARIQQQDQLIRQKRLEIQRQQISIQQLKGKIFVGKRQLQCVYNHQAIQAKEDEIKTLRNALRILEDEKEGHLNIQKAQSKALKVARNQEEYGEKLRNVVSQAGQLRKESKTLLEKIAAAEKVLYRTHDSYVGKREKMKELEQKLALNKEKAKNKKGEALISEQMVQGLESQVRRLQGQRKEGERAWQEKIKAIDVELMVKRSQQQKKLLIMRQKQKQLKINQLKIKELRKLARQIEDRPSQSQRGSQEMDMSQFRHKRNIRYIQK